MTVNELIELLSEMPQEMEVKIGFQPNYPLSANCVGVWYQDNDTDDEDFQSGYGDILYILAGHSDEYFTNKAWQEAQY